MRIKKRRGVFYTPSELAAVLAAWSIRRSDDVALEPSFGGCGFISALCSRFVSLGHHKPLDNIFGCDIDARAFADHLPQSVGHAYANGHFIKRDFLSLTRAHFGNRTFTAILGNPPYVSYHNMYQTQRVAAAAIRRDEWFQVSGMASLWAYFIFHAIRFLEIGGRMAWVLPGSLLHSDYGKKLLHELAARFERVTVISLGERVFADAGVSESTEILLCEELLNVRQVGPVEVATAENVRSCADLLGRWSTQQGVRTSLNGRAVPALVGDPILAPFSSIASRGGIIRFGDVARFKIGIVTGANSLFVINKSTSEEHCLPTDALRPILAKFGTAPGMRLMSADLRRAQNDQARCLFIDRRKTPYSKRVQKYFAAFPEKAREQNVTFKKYIDWRCPDDGDIPDAFFPYMHHIGPRLVLNAARVNATNTIHRVYFNNDVPKSQQKAVAISLLSTFSQISAELEGRSYGGGVLKHEPSEARRIQLILPTRFERLDTLFSEVDQLLRHGRADEARLAVDRALVASGDKFGGLKDWTLLCQTLTALRNRRHGRSKTK